MSDDDSGTCCASFGEMPLQLEQILLAQAVGTRMRAAREAAGMSLLAAAQQLGYGKSSKLAKIESGKDSTQLPLWLITRCARLYEVSADYLIGNSETMEVDSLRHIALRETMMHMRERRENLLERNVTVQRQTLTRAASAEQIAAEMTAAAMEVRAAMARIAELNPDWQDIRGGPRLVGAIGRISDAGLQLDTEGRPEGGCGDNRRKAKRGYQTAGVTVASQRAGSSRQALSV